MTLVHILNKITMMFPSLIYLHTKEPLINICLFSFSRCINSDRSLRLKAEVVLPEAAENPVRVRREQSG